MTRVVHCKRSDYDIYIGRGPCPKTGRTGPWGNPFKIGEVYRGRVLDRDTCLEAYESWLMGSLQGLKLRGRLRELRGKVLGCWCKPGRKCHGDILAALADQIQVIDSFRGEYFFLSNFYGGAYSLEHLYQAAKATNDKDKLYILDAPTPGEAKRRGRMVKCDLLDWECEKFYVMERLLDMKFKDPVLRKKLLDTGDVELVEGNDWGDTTWGVCNGVGENMLGQLLMALRKQLWEESQ